MKIDESLARGLCSRFFAEASDHLDQVLLGVARQPKFRGTRASWEKFVIESKSRLYKVALTMYEGGSKRRPYFAFCALHIEENRQVQQWQERAIQGKQVFIDFDRNVESLHAPFSIGEHTIARMIARGNFNVRHNNGFDVLRILDGFDYVPLWSAFWSNLGIYLKAKGLDIDRIELAIPSRAGLFLCKLSQSPEITAFPVVEVRTFVDNGLLSNEQSWVQREMLAISHNLKQSPLALFPLVNVFQLDDSHFLERVLHYKLMGSLNGISSILTGLIEPDTDRQIYRNAIVEINHELSKGITADAISVIESIGIRAAQVQIRSAILRRGC